MLVPRACDDREEARCRIVRSALRIALKARKVGLRPLILVAVSGIGCPPEEVHAAVAVRGWKGTLLSETLPCIIVIVSLLRSSRAAVLILIY